jgi:hypothetical protein
MFGVLVEHIIYQLCGIGLRKGYGKSLGKWITQQIYLIMATIKNIRTKEIVWDKQDK